MTGRIGNVNVTSNKSFIIYSPSWGLLRELDTLSQLTDAMEKGVNIPTSHPYQLGHGQRVKTAVGYWWSDGGWKVAVEYAE